MYAKKSLGQNFLKSERALEKIIEAGNLSEGDTVLEIGPGLGALTEKLLVNSKQVIAVEKDDTLYEFLKTKFKNEIESGKLKLIHEDILDFKAENYFLSTDYYKLIANIPYNITGAIFEKFLSSDNQPERMVLLVQKEVAERIVAKKNKPFDSAQGKESILSISVKIHGEPRLVDRVLAGSFVPAPKVDSAIIAIENISKSNFADFSEENFFKILKTGFKSKRKKLSSNLSGMFPKTKVQETFEKLGFDNNIRAEDLKIDGWKRLARELLS